MKHIIYFINILTTADFLFLQFVLLKITNQPVSTKKLRKALLDKKLLVKCKQNWDLQICSYFWQNFMRTFYMNLC
jgi:hypothetical protein